MCRVVIYLLINVPKATFEEILRFLYSLFFARWLCLYPRCDFRWITHLTPNSVQTFMDAFTAHGVLRLNCLAASTTVPAMKKSIILVPALSLVVMALVSCASHSDVDPLRVPDEATTPYHEPAPAHDRIGGVDL